MRLDPLILISWAPPDIPNGAISFDEDLRERIIDLQVELGSRGGGKASFTMDNRDLALFDNELIDPQNRVYLRFGFSGQMSPVLQVSLTKVTGFRTLKFEGTTSETSVLLTTQTCRSWDNATPWEVAEEIARGLGFVEDNSRVIDPGSLDQTARGIVQAGETDMAFLLRLAGECGADFYVVNGVFHFHERTLDGEPQKTITFWRDREGQIIGEPEIDHNILGRPARTQRRSMSVRERSTTSSTADNSSDADRTSLGDELAVPSDGVTAVQSVSEDETDRQESRNRASFRRVQEAVKVKLTIVGDATIQPGQIVTVDGISERYSGNFHVDKVSHKLASAFTTHLELTRNAVTRSQVSARRRHRAQAETGEDSSRVNGRVNDEPYSSEFQTGWADSTDRDGNPIQVYNGQSVQPPGQSVMPDEWEMDW